MATTIDTHASIRQLEAAGADPKLAEAIVKTVSQADLTNDIQAAIILAMTVLGVLAVIILL